MIETRWGRKGAWIPTAPGKHTHTHRENLATVATFFLGRRTSGHNLKEEQNRLRDWKLEKNERGEGFF